MRYIEKINDELTLIIDYKFGKIASRLVRDGSITINVFSERDLIEGIQVKDTKLKVEVIKRPFLFFPKIQIYINEDLAKSSDTHEEIIMRNILNLFFIFFIC